MILGVSTRDSSRFHIVGEKIIQITCIIQKLFVPLHKDKTKTFCIWIKTLTFGITLKKKATLIT